eukprot:scaffold147096_cov23-Tisochrysis_lutea.AAC.1
MGSQRYFEKQSPQHQRGDGFYNQTYRSDTVIAVSAGSTAVQSAAVCQLCQYVNKDKQKEHTCLQLKLQ